MGGICLDTPAILISLDWAPSIPNNWLIQRATVSLGTTLGLFELGLEHCSKLFVIQTGSGSPGVAVNVAFSLCLRELVRRRTNRWLPGRLGWHARSLASKVASPVRRSDRPRSNGGQMRPKVRCESAVAQAAVVWCGPDVFGLRLRAPRYGRESVTGPGRRRSPRVMRMGLARNAVWVWVGLEIGV